MVKIGRETLVQDRPVVGEVDPTPSSEECPDRRAGVGTSLRQRTAGDYQGILFRVARTGTECSGTH